MSFEQFALSLLEKIPDVAAWLVLVECKSRRDRWDMLSGPLCQHLASANADRLRVLSRRPAYAERLPVDVIRSLIVVRLLAHEDLGHLSSSATSFLFLQ